MNYYESVVVDYLRADRSLFINTEFCIQLHEAQNPDTSGPHWYCDAVVAEFRTETIYLVEISYSGALDSLSKRLAAWYANWKGVCLALQRDGHLPSSWPVRPWLFVPEHQLPVLLPEIVAPRRAQRNKFSTQSDDFGNGAALAIPFMEP